MSEKHNAARRLLQAAQEMQALLTEETDGDGVCGHARSSVLHAKVIELLTRPESPPDDYDDDEDEDEEEDT